jgi:hypothetical protein
MPEVRRHVRRTCQSTGSFDRWASAVAAVCLGPLCSVPGATLHRPVGRAMALTRNGSLRVAGTGRVAESEELKHEHRS